MVVQATVLFMQEDQVAQGVAAHLRAALTDQVVPQVLQGKVMLVVTV